jgi:carbonyl reductase 1
VSTLTRILERDFTKYSQHKNIIIYACCPGYCATDMSSNKGIKTAEEGAITPTWLALQDPESHVCILYLSINCSFEFS